MQYKQSFIQLLRLDTLAVPNVTNEIIYPGS